MCILIYHHLKLWLCISVSLGFTKTLKQLAYICEETAGHGKLTKTLKQLAYICEETAGHGKLTKTLKQLAYICEETAGHSKLTNSMMPCIINW